MTTYTISTDESEEAGITAAREAYNERLPSTEVPIETNAAYVAFVMSKAFASYKAKYQVAA